MPGPLSELAVMSRCTPTSAAGSPPARRTWVICLSHGARWVAERLGSGDDLASLLLCVREALRGKGPSLLEAGEDLAGERGAALDEQGVASLSSSGRGRRSSAVPVEVWLLGRGG